MSDPTATTRPTALERRGFLRGGALLAAAAGGAVAATPGSVLPSAAADSDFVSITLGIPPLRLLDTRTTDGRASVVRSSPAALDSKNRLKKDAWIEVAVFPVEAGIALLSVFVNLTSHGSTKAGSLVVTEPEDEKPTGWTLPFEKGKTVSNSAIVGVGVSDDATLFTVRVYASSPTHVTLDLTGVSALVPEDTDDTELERTSRRASAARVTRAARSLRR